MSMTHQIDIWCEELKSQPGVSGDYVEEIKDHLYSHVLREMELGVEPLEALEKATQQLGSQKELGQEFFKNRSVLYRLFFSKQTQNQKGACMKDSRRDKFTPIAHAIMFAVAILASSWLLKDTDHGQTMLYLMLCLWLGTSVLIESVREQLRCEWRFIKRLFGQGA